MVEPAINQAALGDNTAPNQSIAIAGCDFGPRQMHMHTLTLVIPCTVRDPLAAQVYMWRLRRNSVFKYFCAACPATAAQQRTKVTTVTPVLSQFPSNGKF